MNPSRIAATIAATALLLAAFSGSAAAIDTDGDGVDDGQEVDQFVDEVSSGTIDTDGDGVDDGQEVSNTIDNVASGDTDGDGTHDAEEASEFRDDAEELATNPSPRATTVVRTVEVLSDDDTDGDGTTMAEEADDPFECGSLDCTGDQGSGWDGPGQNAPQCGEDVICN